ncbi:MAG: hypothetical protein C0412_19395 [Flavobacterium sp.]|nr:hypothetical protein [Flavobacterium sp.]
MKYIDAQKPCLLEIRLPKEITKSPAAMEIFFSHLNPGGAGTAYWSEVFIDGKTRPWFSCEIVSTGGQVRFFVWCSQIKYRNLVEAQLYAQYPNIEIFEAEDYTKDFYYDPEKYFLYGIQYKLTQPDPFPIKTYIDYGLGLGEDQKEEYKIDPITSLVEFLGSMKKGENAWVQILIQRHEPETWEHGVLKIKVDPKKTNFFLKKLSLIFGKSRDLKDEVKEEIKKIRKEAIPEPEKGEEKTAMKFPNPTKGQNERIAALERSAGKIAYDCMIRNIYITEKSSFNIINISAIIGCFKQYGSLNLNGFKIGFLTDVEDWVKDYGKIFPFIGKMQQKDIERKKTNILYAYKLRSYFQCPYKNYGKSSSLFSLLSGEKNENKPFILTTEELATIFHFPSGMVSQTPTLQRVGSKKSEAPSNLPI